MRKKYLRKKQQRTFSKDESSITEEMGSNANNSICLQKDKSEGKVSTPSNNKSEPSSSTLLDRGKVEKLNTFSCIGKKDNKDKRLSVIQRKEETHNMDYFNEQFQFFQKQLDEFREQKKAQELKINNLEKEKYAQKKEFNNFKKAYELKINNLEKENHAQEVKINNLEKDNGLKINNLEKK